MAIPIVLGVIRIPSHDLRGFEEMEEIVASLKIQSQQSNIIYFGEFRQPFVYYVRIGDFSRRTHILRGDDTFKEEPDLDAMCHDYRIRYLVLETGNPQQTALHSQVQSSLQQNRNFSLQEERRFYVYERYRQVEIYKYCGAMAEKIKPIRLSSDLLNNSEYMMKENEAMEKKSPE